MDNVAKLSRREREELFISTAYDMRLPEAMVEKDFWVCWTLDYLFNSSPWAKRLVFKGGTSLSKCFSLIERFSEDIDLILDWRELDYTLGYPWDDRSKTGQDKLNKEINFRTSNFLKNIILPKLQEDFSLLLPDSFNLFILGDDPQTIFFAYPQIFYNSDIVSFIRLEVGALASWTPSELKIIKPYVAQKHPQIFKKPFTTVLTIKAERTFWEKVTILHKEAFRKNGKYPIRYSRHYYDLYCMTQSTIKLQAYKDIKLLNQVVLFKSRFYPANVARYDLAKPGTMKLIPSNECVKLMNEDYEHMKNMIFGQKPSFMEIIENIQRMEAEINKL